jgi:Flp pilus assembly protein TadB
VSKQRQHARAEREAVRAQQLAAHAAERAREVERSAKARRRQEQWRRIRWWQHGPAFRRDKEKWAALATIVLVCLLVTFLLTSSFKAVFAVALVCAIAAPALGAFLFDRRSR